jgi:hypothetical protein
MQVNIESQTIISLASAGLPVILAVAVVLLAVLAILLAWLIIRR